MTTFPKNNLPTGSLNWGREVEKRISNIDSGLKTAEINNVTRDAQLMASYKRLDATVIDLAATSAAADAAQATATQANTTAIAANTTATNANATAIAANTTAISANSTAISALQLAQSQQGEIDQAQNDALTALGEADQAIADSAAAAAAAATAAQQAADAAGVASLANTRALAALEDVVQLGAPGGPAINASNITGGTINAINISGSQITGGTISGAQVFTSNGAGLTADLVAGSVNLAAPGTSGSLAANSSFGMVLTSSNIVRVSAPSGIQGTSADFGSVNAGNYTGTSNTSIAANTTGSFAGNVFINQSGIMFRSTATSSREAKQNIAPYEFDTESFISVNPVTFNYKPEAVSNPEEAEINQLGFVLEDFEDAGLGEYLVIPSNDVDVYKGLRYDRLYMMLHKVVQEQNETIKDLTARLAALEDRVQ